MRPLYRFLAVLLCLSAFAPSHAQTNYTTSVTVSSLKAGGTAVANGKICAVPADRYGNAINVSAPTWGLVLPKPGLCGTVTAGAITGGIPVPDACHTNAAGPITYNFSIQLLTSGGLPSGSPISLTAVPNVCGPTFALDSYTPAVSVAAPLANVLGYGSGIPSTCTAPSIWISSDSVAAFSCHNGVYQTLAGAQGPPLTFKGTYAPGTPYALGDFVAYAGSSYVSLVAANTGNTPGSSPSQWSVVAAQGGPGTNGQVTNNALSAAIGQTAASTLDPTRNLLNLPGAKNGLIHGNCVPEDNAYGGNFTYAYATIAGLAQITLGFDQQAGGDGSRACYYDITGASLGVANTADAPPGTVLTPPSNAFSIGVWWNTGDYSSVPQHLNLGIYAGSSLPSTPKAFGTVDPLSVANTVSSAVAAGNTAVGQGLSSSGASQQVVSAKNFLDLSATSPGFLSWNGGSPIVDNTTYPNCCLTTDFLSVFGQSSIISTVDIGGGGGASLVWYAGDKVTIVSHETNVTHTHNTAITPPPGAFWLRTSFINLSYQPPCYTFPANWNASTSAMIVGGSTLPCTFVPFRQEYSPLKGLTLASVGDSVFATQPIVQEIAQISGMNLLYLDAVYGRPTRAMLCEWNLPSYAGCGSQSGTSNTTTGQANGLVNGSYSPPAGETLATSMSKVAFFILQTGANDASPTQSYGSYSDAASATASSLVANFRYVIETVQAASPLTRIVWVPPYNMPGRMGTGSNNVGNYPQPYGMIPLLTLVAQDYGVTVINVSQNSGMNAFNPAYYNGDAVHPSYLGASKLLAPYITRQLFQLAPFTWF